MSSTSLASGMMPTSDTWLVDGVQHFTATSLQRRSSCSIRAARALTGQRRPPRPPCVAARERSRVRTLHPSAVNVALFGG
eukprot:3056970-Pleurochrysis_carterae.AAC.1